MMYDIIVFKNLHFQASTRKQQTVFKDLHFEDHFLKSAFSAPENAVYV